MMQFALLVLLLAAAAPAGPAVTIYVGPHVRDGFVDVDQGVLDSIKDVQKKLLRDKAFVVVPDEGTATLKLYVMARGVGAPTGDGVAIPVAGMSLHFSTKTRYVAALLRVEGYERSFVAEDGGEENWKRCAEVLARDVSAWLKANHERIATKE